MKARIWLLGGLALAMLGIAGCGGGDDADTTAPAATTTAPTTLTKQELITQGDAICAEVNAAVGSIATTDADAASRAAQEGNLYEGMVERLKGLGRPDDATGYEEFIGAADALARAQSDAALAAARGDTTALQVAQSDASAALASFQSAAEAFGFEDCGDAPSAPVAPAGNTTPSESGGTGGVEEEVAPEAAGEVEAAPETGAAEGGGAAAGGGTPGGGTEGSGGGNSGGIGPG